MQSKKPLKILLVGVECAPYANVGGIASVVAYLARELKSRGNEIAVFMPKFGSIDESVYKMELVYEGLQVPTGDEHTEVLFCNVKKHKSLSGVTVYF